MTDTGLTLALTLGFAFGGLSLAFNSYLRYLQTRAEIRNGRLEFDLKARELELDSRYQSKERGRDRELVRKYEDLALRVDELSSRVNPQTSILKPDASASAFLPTLQRTSTGNELLRIDNRSESQLVVRQIAHSLKTPLSQIEVAMELLRSSSAFSNEDAQAINRARSSVAICQAFIQAFRQVVLAETGISEDGDESLGTILESTLSSIEPRPVINIPNKIPGYTHAFVLAVLMPLLDNATEATDSGTAVHLECESNDEHHTLNVVNHSATVPPEDCYAVGVSTKPGHDGVGLAVAKRLVSSEPEGSLEHSVQGRKITFTVSLPVKH
ncbi:sensor histidine kinase [Rhodococcoides fascians]|uniref:sensor histidine kinase n=1 Tax=Rhodococcoides fascians TaxID=1828 RepID=UPI0012D2F172|nr:ATP-binding protein [Rhodococcus fascians]